MTQQIASDCPNLIELKEGTVGEILFVMEDTAAKYYECKEKHKAAVKQYQEVESIIDEFNKGL